MSERTQHRGTTLLRPRRAGSREAPPSPDPEPTPRMNGFWPLLVLVIVGTLALGVWALWPSASSDLERSDSGYTGDWKDTVARERAEAADDGGGAGAGYSGDWKDTLARERVGGAGDGGGAGSGYSGDWKDTVASERAESAQR